MANSDIVPFAFDPEPAIEGAESRVEVDAHRRGVPEIATNEISSLCREHAQCRVARDDVACPRRSYSPQGGAYHRYRTWWAVEARSRGVANGRVVGANESAVCLQVGVSRWRYGPDRAGLYSPGAI